MRRTLLSLLGRAAWILAIGLGATASVHLILRLAPGSDDAMPSFLDWLGEAVTGNLGESKDGDSVGRLILQASAESIFVVGWAVVFSFAGAVALTLLWTGRGSTYLSRPSRVFAYVLSSSPIAVLGYWIVRTAIAYGTSGSADWYYADVSFTSIKHWLAAFVLGVCNGMLMESARALDSEVRRLLDSDYILFARARGRPLWKHLGLGLVAPVTNSIVNRLTAIFGGAIIAELVFNIQGLGRLTWDAASARDMHVLLGAASVWAFGYALCHLTGDFFAALVDPRLRSSAMAEESA